MKVGAFAPSEVDYVSELTKGRFSVTANVNHKSKFATCKLFDKSDPEGEDSAKVWPLTQFFLFPFGEKSLICLEGKSMTLVGETLFSSVPPSTSLVSISDP